MLILDPQGVERFRIEGYLPTAEYRAQLELGLARAAFMRKKWADAEARYGSIVERHPESGAAPEAAYWTGVAQYKSTNDHAALEGTAAQLARQYAQSIWAKKASIWLK